MKQLVCHPTRRSPLTYCILVVAPILYALIATITPVQAKTTRANPGSGAIGAFQPAARQVSRIDIEVGTIQLLPGEQTTVTVTVRDELNQPMAGTVVSLFGSWGTLSASSGLSNGDGQIIVSFTAGNIPGQATITALAGYEAGSAVIQIKPSNSNQPPTIPNTPSPTDRTVNLPPTSPIVLSWQGGDPDGDLVAYTVVFGDINPPPIVANSVLTTSFQPDISSSATTYYWSILASDGEHQVVGPVWSFTLATSVPPAYTPINPSPADGAINVPLTQSLSWEIINPDNDPMTYTVALGTANPPPVVATRIVANYTPHNLISDTTYYWVITATNGVTTSSGPVWRFTTIGDENLGTIYLPIVLKKP